MAHMVKLLATGWTAVVSCLLRVAIFLNCATVSRIAMGSTQLLVSWG